MSLRNIIAAALLLSGLTYLYVLISASPYHLSIRSSDLAPTEYEIDTARSQSASDSKALSYMHVLHILHQFKVQKAQEFREMMLATSTREAYLEPFVAVHEACGRLGNTMFQIASLLGIAHMNRRRPVPFFVNMTSLNFEGLWLYNETKVPESENTTKCTPLQNGVGIYDKRFENLTAICGPHKPVALKGCLQSWKYFSNIESDVRKMFVFKSEVFQAAEEHLLTAIQQVTDGQRNCNWKETVGVHVRRQDFQVQRDDGIIAAPDSYYMDALAEFTAKDVLIFVISDDYDYCQKLFSGSNMYVLPTSDAPEVDMAFLQMMDHLIISAGTFGWWSAYLGRAKSVFYYKDWPRSGSYLTPRFSHEDYFPASWIGRS